MGVGEIAGLIAAIAFAVLAGFMIYPLIRLGKMFDQISQTVRLSGVEWTARSADGSPVAVGTVVRIDAIEGVKLIVTPVPVPNK